MAISLAVQKMLWGKSASACNKCKVPVVNTNSQGQTFHKGENAHIEGENITAARYNEAMTDDERSSYGNLILMCSSCHTEIDKDVVTYTVEVLKKIKKD